MPIPSIKLTQNRGEHPLWQRRSWDPAGRPRGLGGRIAVASTDPENEDWTRWLWADQDTARAIVRAIASESAAQLQAGQVADRRGIPRHKLLRLDDEALAEFYELAMLGNIALLYHRGLVVGFIRQDYRLSDILVPRLIETQTVL